MKTYLVTTLRGNVMSLSYKGDSAGWASDILTLMGGRHSLPNLRDQAANVNMICVQQDLYVLTFVYDGVAQIHSIEAIR